MKSAIRSCLAALLASLAAAGAETAAPVIPVNDAALRVRFQREMERWLGAADAPKGAQLLPDWEKKRREGGKAGSVILAKPAEGASNQGPLTSPRIYERAIRATMMIGHLYQCGKCDKWHPSIAGGVAIDPSGIVVTNYHVMEADKAEIFGAMTVAGEAYPIVAVLAASKANDLAMVKLETGGKRIETVPVAPGDDPAGSEVRVISHPDGRFFTFSDGIVARYCIDPRTKAPRLQITADFAKGSSGCGVFNDRGELTGIVSSTDSIYYTVEAGEHKNLQMVVKTCIPAATLRKLAQLAP